MLKIENLNFAYNKNKPVLNNISFEVEKGRLCGLFGPNGCGKTTLFKCCLRFLRFENGSVNINGDDIKGKSVKEIAKLMSYVPQEHKPSFPYLVRDVVLMGRTPHLKGIFGTSKDDKKIAKEALKLVGIKQLAEIPYNQLSGGQRQLVIIARAVAQKSKVMFLDEPTSALDFSNQIRVWKLLRNIAALGSTVVACTHDPNHVIWFCDDVVVMGNGGLVAVGSPQEIISEPTLDKIYEKVCSVESIKKTKVVYPREFSKIDKKNRKKLESDTSHVANTEGEY